jgi:hypothetical protein
VISHDVLKSLREPTPFEKWVANQGLHGSQRDHYHFSTAINGLFWYDPALYPKVYKILRSPVFGMSDRQARLMMASCFAEESEGLHASAKSRQIAIDSYREYLADLEYVDRTNKEMAIMRRNSVERHLSTNRHELQRFFRQIDVSGFRENANRQEAKNAKAFS